MYTAKSRLISVVYEICWNLTCFVSEFPVFRQKRVEFHFALFQVLGHLRKSSPWRSSLRCKYEHTFRSTSFASALISSTSLSFSRRSITISSYSLCSRSIVCWLADRFSCACLWARSSLSWALERCFNTLCSIKTDCDQWNVEIKRPGLTSLFKISSFLSIFFSSRRSFTSARSLRETSRLCFSFSMTCRDSIQDRTS